MPKQNMGNQDKLFKFNLLPPKSAQEVALEEEGADSSVYAFVLVFVASLIYLILVVVQAFLIDPRITTANQALNRARTELNSYSSVRLAHGELHIKSKALAEVLALSVAPDDIFKIADQIAGNSSDVTIEAYGREQASGLFLFQLAVSDITKLPTVIQKTKQIDGVSDVLVRTASVSSQDQKVRVNLTLSIQSI